MHELNPTLPTIQKVVAIVAIIVFRIEVRIRIIKLILPVVRTNKYRDS